MRSSAPSLEFFIALFLLSGCGGSTSDLPSGSSAIGPASVDGPSGDRYQATTGWQDNGQNVAPSQALAKVPVNTKSPVLASREPNATVLGLPSADRPTFDNKSQPDHEAHEREA